MMLLRATRNRLTAIKAEVSVLKVGPTRMCNLYAESRVQDSEASSDLNVRGSPYSALV